MQMIIIDAIASLAVCLVWYAWQKYIKPWLVERRLYEAAEVAVEAAEALYGRYHGEEKFQQALGQLEALGFSVDADNVIKAVDAAWQKLNTSQIAAGEKVTTSTKNPIDD